MIDGRDITLNDVLGSRSKIQLGNYLSAFPKEEREKVDSYEQTIEIFLQVIISSFAFDLNNCTNSECLGKEI